MVNWRNMFFVTLGLFSLLVVSAVSLSSEIEIVSADDTCNPIDVADDAWANCPPTATCGQCLDRCNAACDNQCTGLEWDQCRLQCLSNWLSCLG